MKRLLLSIGICLCFMATSFGQSAGDIAFIGFNSDGDKDLSIVILSDIPNTTIYLTDNEWDSTAFTSGEGALAWVTGGTISAGTVVTFSDVNATVTVSIGSVTEPDAGFNPTNSSEAIYAFLGTDESTPTTFLAAISNRAYDNGSTVGTLFGTGLTEGVEAVNLGDTDLDADVGVYNSFKQALSKTDFLALIGNASNWLTDDGSGDQSAPFLPFSTTSFEFTNAREISGNAGWRLLSLPKTGGTVSDISDDTAVQGVSGGDNIGASSNFKIYDNSGAFEDPADVSTSWGDGYGFALYFYDNTNAGSSELPISLDVSGSEPSSDVSVSLNSGASNQFTLVGNPFASNYNTNSITGTGGSISDNISFWNDGTSSYSAQDRTTNYIISPWQGFWVETADASVSGITIGTAGKSSSATSGTFFSKTVSNRGDIAFTLSSENSYDEAIKLAVRDYATLGFDRADASKLVPMLTTYATMAFKDQEGKLKSVESLPWNLDEEIKLDLELTQVQISGGFTFDWKGLESIPSEWKLTFYDYEMGTKIDMRSESKFVFDSEAPASKIAHSLSILNGPVAVEQKSKSAGTRFGITITPNTTSVNNEEEGKVEGFALSQNYPNPFNPTTTINYSVENTGPVTISIYNLMGQKVAELVNESKAAGSYNVTWNAANAASGMYYYRLESAGQTLTRKMTLIK